MKELRTPRLRLEPLEGRHASVLFAGLCGEPLYEFLSDRSPVSEAPVRERFQRTGHPASPARQACFSWALCLRSSGRYVGYVQATPYGNGSASIVYVLFRNAWGHGYVQEVAAALIGHLRERWGTTRIQATIDTSSFRSMRLFQAMHFQTAIAAGQ